MTTNFPIYLFQGVLLGLVVSVVAGVLAIWIARRWNLIDTPGREAHKRHSKPVPLAGGIALVLAILIGWLTNPGRAGGWAWFILPPLLVFGIGLVDDYRPVRSWIKLVGQGFAALLLIGLGGQVHAVENGLRDLPLLLSQGLDVTITILWLVGIANAYNFVDSMDGLATGLSVIVFAFFAIGSFIAGQILLAGLLSYLVGACLGLYFLNCAPAKLFLGNSGALFMGFLLAETAIAYNPLVFQQLSSWFIPIMVLGLPLFDMILVVTSRLRRGIPVDRADLGHTYHRLVEHGLDPGRAVVTMQMASILLGCLAFISIDQTPLVANAIFLVVCIVGLGVLLYLDYPPYQPRDGA